MVRLEIPSNPYHPNLVYTYISILPTSSEGIKKIWREIPWWPTRVNLSYDIHDFLQHPEKLALNAWYTITASYPIADAGTRNRIEPMRRSGDDEFTVNPSLIKWPHQGLRTPLKHTRKRDSFLWRIEIDVLFSRNRDESRTQHNAAAIGSGLQYECHRPRGNNTETYWNISNTTFHKINT